MAFVRSQRLVGGKYSEIIGKSPGDCIYQAIIDISGTFHQSLTGTSCKGQVKTIKLHCTFNQCERLAETRRTSSLRIWTFARVGNTSRVAHLDGSPMGICTEVRNVAFFDNCLSLYGKPRGDGGFANSIVAQIDPDSSIKRGAHH